MRFALGVVLAIVANILSLSVGSTKAAAQKRVALVIGNSAYRYTPALINPQNDATDMSAALKKLGYQVIDGFDLDKTSLDRSRPSREMLRSTALVATLPSPVRSSSMSHHRMTI